MIVFAYESITGGGLACQPLPAGLAEEGDCMLRALVGELLEVPGIEVVTTRDRRMPPLRGVSRAITVGPADDADAVFLACASGADAVWPIAPETGGELERLCRRVLASGTRLLGARPAAIAVAASKRRTADVLAAREVAVVPAFSDPASLPTFSGPWVVKPDDGAGCVDTVRVADGRRAAALLAVRPEAKLIAQPWIEGEALSLSLVCDEVDADVLSCNRQHIDVADGVLSLRGIEVAAVAVMPAHVDLARRVVEAIPGLWGYVGIDFVETADGPVVIEVNPRITTSYCDLGRVLGINLARRVLDMAGGSSPFALPPIVAARSGLAGSHG